MMYKITLRSDVEDPNILISDTIGVDWIEYSESDDKRKVRGGEGKEEKGKGKVREEIKRRSFVKLYVPYYTLCKPDTGTKDGSRGLGGP